MAVKSGWRTARRAPLLIVAGATFASQACAESSPSPAVSPTPHFMIRAFQVKGNHLISPFAVEDAVYPFMGPDKTPADVEHARATLQSVFQKQGYATVSVFIPEQSVETGIIRLDVQTQTIGQVAVSGGRRTFADWVKKRAPSLTQGTVPNFQAVQRDIVALNQSADRKVTPDVKAGVAPGTVDVTLKVQDTLPLHGSLEYNNDQSPETTPYRLLGTLRYDDLWGRGDSVSLSAQTAPERPGDATVYSANYLAHVGRLQLLGYYVHSDSNVAVVGGTTVIGKGDLAGVRVIIPISQTTGFYQSLTAGIDYKDFGEDVRLGADRSSSPVTYFPLTIGWRGDWTATHAQTDVSLTGTFGLRGLGDGLVAFDNKRYDATPGFSYVRLDISHTADIAYGVQLWGHVTGQYSGNALISNEEFSLGGLTTVRGYDESEALGDYGAAIQTEARTPNLAQWMGAHALDDLRFFVFFDAGWSGINDPLPGQVQSDWLSSSGLGATTRLLKHVNAAVDVGAPIVSGPNTKAGDLFARFRIWGDF